MQSNLHSFFAIKRIHNENHKKCFIYDPNTYKAYFAPKPDEEKDIFICIKSGLKLYFRKPTAPREPVPFVSTDADIPLLKSNLQKAIRRGNHHIAVSTALAILQKEPIELLRRLPIIYVEDVSLIDSLPIVIWLMMADKKYTLTSTDVDILLQVVHSLCTCSKCFDGREIECLTVYTHEMLENEDGYNELLGLYYRSLYGGMKGDMQLLKDAIFYYATNPHCIVRYSFTEVYPFEINLNVYILAEAVDFHPYPAILTTISKNTKLDKSVIKACIWFADSGYNIRKQYTIEASKEYKEKREYGIILPHLMQIQSDLCKDIK